MNQKNALQNHVPLITVFPGFYRIVIARTTLLLFHNIFLFLSSEFLTGLQSMPGEYVARGGPMGVSMGQPSYTQPQMPPHPAQLRHGPPMHTYIPGHPHHPTVMMHGGPPHPGMPMSASSPTVLNTGDPTMSGQVMDIHAQ